MNNPMQMLQAIKNPKQFVINYMQNNTNPMLKNLVDMANNNDTKGLETFAQNMFKEQNRDFSKEFTEFMNNFK